eukprot:521225-Amphidinium_carterae.1
MQLPEVVGKMEGKNDLKDQKAACQKKAHLHTDSQESRPPECPIQDNHNQTGYCRAQLLVAVGRLLS